MLKTVLESLDGLDEAVSKLYTENDGKFILQLEGIDHHPEVASLKNAYERVKADKTAAIQERDAFKLKADNVPEDFDPKIWEKAKDGKADEAALVALRSELEAERDQWKAKATESDSKLNKFSLDRDLSDALLSVGITEPAYSQAARMMLSDKVRTDDNGKAIVESDMGPLALGDYVKKWAAGEGQAFVTPPKGGNRNGNNSSGTATGSAKRSEMKPAQKAEYIKEHGQEAYNKLPD